MNSTPARAITIVPQHHPEQNRAETARAIRRAERQLARNDPIMRRLIAKHGPCPLAEREFAPFHMLANSIISQQLSTHAAAAIKRRVGALIGMPFQSAKVLVVTDELLRGSGLSQAKARYIRELAMQVADGRLEIDEMHMLDDEAVIERLVQVPGIGRWTAQMFLLFGLKRPDVLALGDAGLQRAARVLYGNGRKSKTLLLDLDRNGSLTVRSLPGICGGRWKISEAKP